MAKKSLGSVPKLHIHKWFPGDAGKIEQVVAIGRVWMQGTGVNFKVEFIYDNRHNYQAIRLGVPEGLALHSNTKSRIKMAFFELKRAVCGKFSNPCNRDLHYEEAVDSGDSCWAGEYEGVDESND